VNTAASTAVMKLLSKDCAPRLRFWSLIVDPPPDRRGARTRHPDAITLDATVEIAAVLVLLEDRLERVQESPAALVEHALFDDLVGPQ
jgi:hypothetical protein